ncbi:MAG: peptidylprolyl isomerase [Actinomycetota bacterium]
MKTKLFALLGAAVIVFAACDEVDVTARAAASVDGRKITVEEVDRELARFEETGQYEQLTSQEEPGRVRRQFQQGYLSQIVRRYVLSGEAEERDIEISQSEIDDSLETIQADFPSEEEFEAAVDQQGLTIDQLVDLVRDQIVEEKLREEISAGLQPNDDELQSFYDENIDDYRETEASHILVEQQGQASKLASQLQKARPNEVDKLFAELAKKFSEDPGSGENGGELGFFAPGQFVPEFEQAAAELELGEISEPVQSQFGFHIIRVTDRRLQPFEQAREQIAQELGGAEAEQAYQDFVRRAYEDADVRVNPRYGELDLETQRIGDATAEDVPGAEEPEGTAPPGENGADPGATPPIEE